MTQYSMQHMIFLPHLHRSTCHYANVQTDDMQIRVSIQREVCTYYGCPLMAPVHIPYKLCPTLDKKLNSSIK